MSVIKKLERITNPDVRRECEREIQRDAYRRSLFATSRRLLGYGGVNQETHGRMLEVLQNGSPRKLIVMPRGCFKTSIAGIAFPIWLLLSNPNLRILLDSELYSNSKNMLREIKSHFESQQFIELFGDWRGPVWNEGEIIISTRTVVKKEATIACSGIGAEKTGTHWDVIIADDMNSPSNSNTPEGCEKVILHYKYYTSLLEPQGIIVVVGTRYKSNDLIGQILENELGLKDGPSLFKS